MMPMATVKTPMANAGTDEDGDGEKILSEAERVVFAFVELGRAMVHLRRAKKHVEMAKVAHWMDPLESLRVDVENARDDYAAEFEKTLKAVLPRDFGTESTAKGITE